MKKSFFVLLLIIFSNQLSAQLPLFTQYRQFENFLNPAAINTDYFTLNPGYRFFKFGGGHRIQWLANDFFTSTTSIINGQAFTNLNDGPISIMGGGYAISDDIGATAVNSIAMNGAIYIGNEDQTFLGGIGFGFGTSFHTIDLERLKSFDSNDPLLNLSKLTANTPDISVGLFGMSHLGINNRLYFGLSIPQLIEYELTFEEDANYNSKLSRHFYGNLGYIHLIDNATFIHLSSWARYIPGLLPELDFNFQYQLSTFWLGFGASTNQLAHLEMGFNIPSSVLFERDDSENYIKLGYGIDFPLNSSYASSVGMTHEIIMAYVIY